MAEIDGQVHRLPQYAFAIAIERASGGLQSKVIKRQSKEPTNRRWAIHDTWRRQFGPPAPAAHPYRSTCEGTRGHVWPRFFGIPVKRYMRIITKAQS